MPQERYSLTIIRHIQTSRSLQNRSLLPALQWDIPDRLFTMSILTPEIKLGLKDVEIDDEGVSNKTDRSSALTNRISRVLMLLDGFGSQKDITTSTT